MNLNQNLIINTFVFIKSNLNAAVNILNLVIVYKFRRWLPRISTCRKYLHRHESGHTFEKRRREWCRTFLILYVKQNLPNYILFSTFIFIGAVSSGTRKRKKEYIIIQMAYKKNEMTLAWFLYEKKKHKVS